MERFETSVRYRPWYEHWHRYHFIKELVRGKNVCDIACGEGYGSAMLTSSAKTVTGVDIDEKTILAAQKKYKSVANLSYIKSNALELCFEDNEFDVIVSFETLEHLAEHDLLLNEFKRVLTKDGVLIISTPDKDVYSADEDHNEYHIKELTKVEFDHLISSKFSFTQSFGQQFQLMSVIENLQDSKFNQNRQHIYVEPGKEHNSRNNNSPAKYLIKICTDDEQSLNKLNITGWHAFSDTENSLYHHFEEQIQRLLLIDEQNHGLRDTIAKQSAIISHLKSRLGY